MTFLNLWLLLALPAAVLPVVIYYLVNRKRKKLYFAAFEWMMKAAVKRRKLNKIDDLLKLIAKICLVIAIILFMARPAFNTFGARNVLVVIDTTPSMSATEADGSTRLDEARETAKMLAAEFENANVSFATFDGKLEVILKNVSPKGPFNALDAVETGVSDAALAELAGALNSLPDSGSYDTICFISDFQRSKYTDKREIKNIISSFEGQRIVFVPLENKGRVPNVAIESFSIPPEGFIPGRNNRISVVAANYSDENAESVNVVLSVDGVKKHMDSATIAPDSKAEMSLILNIPPERDSLVEISIGPDALKGDNRLLFSARPRAKLNILGVVPSDVQTSFKADIFMKNAVLAASDNADMYSYTTITPEQFAGVALDNYDTVIFYGIAFDTESGIARDISKYIASGRTVISFSDLSTPSFWKGLGVDLETVVHEGAFIPDVERLGGTWLEFMSEGRNDPDKFVFSKVGSFVVNEPAKAEETETGKATETPSDGILGKLYLKGIKEPVGIQIKHGDGKLLLLGYMPTTDYTQIMFNGNFVQYTMRLVADAFDSGTFGVASGIDSMNIPIRDGAQYNPGDTMTIVLIDNAQEMLNATEKEKTGVTRIDGTVRRTRNEGALVLALEQNFSTNSFATVYRKGVELFKIGLNTARTDSDLARADEAVFSDAVDAGLVIRSGEDVLSGNARRETFTGALILLLCAVFFDIYAHFLRKK